MIQYFGVGLNHGKDVFILWKGKRNYSSVLDVWIFKYLFDSQAELIHTHLDQLDVHLELDRDNRAAMRMLF